MNLIYIDNNDIINKIFVAAAATFSNTSCLGFNDTRRAIVHLISDGAIPDFIFVSRNIGDISYKDLIKFIRKQDKLNGSKAIVIAESLSRREISDLSVMGADHYVEAKFTYPDLIATIRATIGIFYGQHDGY